MWSTDIFRRTASFVWASHRRYIYSNRRVLASSIAKAKRFLDVMGNLPRQYT